MPRPLAGGMQPLEKPESKIEKTNCSFPAEKAFSKIKDGLLVFGLMPGPVDSISLFQIERARLISAREAWGISMFPVLNPTSVIGDHLRLAGKDTGFPADCAFAIPAKDSDTKKDKPASFKNFIFYIP